MDQHGLILATELELAVLPIGPGTKFPGQFRKGTWHGYHDWERHADRGTTEYEVDVWSRWPGCGIGIATGWRVGAFDADIKEPELADKISRIAREELGLSPVRRIGNAPKFLDFYRIDLPFRSIKAHPIEFLSYGNQCVAYAVHPETGQPYTYPMDALHEIRLEELPEVTEDQVRQCLARCVEIIPRDLRQRRLPDDRRREMYCSGGDPTGTVTAMTAAMRFIPNDDLPYDDWLRIAYSLKAGIGEDGWPLFNEWSRKSQKYNAAFTRKTWKGIRRDEIREDHCWHRLRLGPGRWLGPGARHDPVRGSGEGYEGQPGCTPDREDQTPS
jgi:hypothetical protein